MARTHKSGYRTTEFWVTVLTDVAILAAAIEGALTPRYAAIAGAISNVGYSLARGLTKAGMSDGGH